MAAAGSFGKAIAFYGCKNIQSVRKYTIPSRPNTPLQQQQTSFMTQAVRLWQNWPHSKRDEWAWGLWGAKRDYRGVDYSIMISQLYDSVKNGNLWSYLGMFDVVYKSSTQLIVIIQGTPATPTPTLCWSRNSAWQTSRVVMSPYAPNAWFHELYGLNPKQLYYFRFEAGTKWVDWGETGVYYERTSPTPPWSPPP